jgi:DNA-binding response OmpR family regulator
MLDVRKLQYLLIDGDASHTSRVRMSLTQFGCRNVIFANTLQKAIDAIKAYHIDLVIFTSHDDSGWKFVDWARNPKLNPRGGVPILGILHPDDNCVLHLVVRRGVNYVLLIPFSAARLGDRIKKTLITKLKMTRTATYYGPDRRRMPDADFTGQDRRLSPREREKRPQGSPRTARLIDNQIKTLGAVRPAPALREAHIPSWRSE